MDTEIAVLLCFAGMFT